MTQRTEVSRKPQVAGPWFDNGYRAMAADTEREAEALAWVEGLITDMADEGRERDRSASRHLPASG